MKKFVLFLFAMTFPLLLSAQNEAVAEAMATMTKKYFDLTKSLQDSVNTLRGQYRNIQQDNETDARIYYEKKAESIRQTANVIEAMNKSLSAMKASLSATEYFTSISALNNPTNEELGFRLETEILKIMQDKIFVKSGRSRRMDKFRKIVSNVINNPITNLIVSNIPVVSSISSVVNMVNTSFLDDDNISVDDLKSFGGDIKKFVEHYENLAKANAELMGSTKSIRTKIDAMESLLTDYVRSSASDLYPQDGKVIENQSVNELVRTYYSYSRVDATIRNIEKTYLFSGRLNYDKLLKDKRLEYSIMGRQKISFLGDELEKIADEYSNTLDSFHKSIVQVLAKANDLTKDKLKIQQKSETLNRQYTNLKATYEQSLDLKTTRLRLSEVPKF
jgi:hypothetical protein